MNQLEIDLNKILMLWNPIGINGSALKTEYIIYIPRLIEESSNIQQVYNLLKFIVVKEMELPFDENNPKHNDDLLEIAHNIFILCNKQI